MTTQSEPRPYANTLFEQALKNRLQRKQDLLQIRIPELLKEIEKHVEAGRLACVMNLEVIEAECLRLPEFGLRCTLMPRSSHIAKSRYVVTWATKDGLTQADKDYLTDVGAGGVEI